MDKLIATLLATVDRDVVRGIPDEAIAELAQRTAPIILALLTNDPDRLLTTSEAAEQARVNVQTVRRWVDAGKLEAARRGSRIGIRQSALDAYLKRDEPQTGQRPAKPKIGRQASRSTMRDAISKAA